LLFERTFSLKRGANVNAVFDFANTSQRFF